MALLEVREVAKRYGSIPVLNGLRLEVETSECVGSPETFGEAVGLDDR